MTRIVRQTTAPTTGGVSAEGKRARAGSAHKALLFSPAVLFCALFALVFALSAAVEPARALDGTQAVGVAKSLVANAPETLGVKLRRLARNADAANPLTHSAMASPPTISNSATHTTALSVYVARTSSVFRYIGAAQSGGYFTSTPSVGVAGTSGWGVEFDTDSPKFEIWATCGGGCPSGGVYGRLFVDGIAASLSYTSIPANSGYTLVDFTSAGGRKMRHFRWETGTGATSFSGLQVSPYDTVTAPPATDGLRCLFIGDSITQGTGSTYQFSAYPQVAAKYIGCDDPWASGVAGSGYLNAGTGQKLGARMAQDIIATPHDVAIFAMGVNDVPYYTPAQIQAEATADFTTYRASLPKTFVVVLGPWPRTDQTAATQQAASDAIKAAVNAADPAGVAAGRTCFVDTSRVGPSATTLITGTGTDTAPASNGNADWYISGAAANPHPNQAGHEMYGRWLAQQIRACETALP